MKIYIVVYEGESGSAWPSLEFDNFFLSEWAATEAIRKLTKPPRMGRLVVKEFIPSAQVVPDWPSHLPHTPSLSEQMEAELEPRRWDGHGIGEVLKHGRE